MEGRSTNPIWQLLHTVGLAVGHGFLILLMDCYEDVCSHSSKRSLKFKERKSQHFYAFRVPGPTERDKRERTLHESHCPCLPFLPIRLTLNYVEAENWTCPSCGLRRESWNLIVHGRNGQPVGTWEENRPGISFSLHQPLVCTCPKYYKQVNGEWRGTSHTWSHTAPNQCYSQQPGALP